MKTAKSHADRIGVRHPNLIVEWGRYVAAPAQITIFKVLSEKVMKNGVTKRWYTVDGSFINDLADTWAIHQKWHVIPINNMSGRVQPVWLAGSSCDSDDKYTAGGGHLLLPKLDGACQYVAILDTGAYQDSLASSHCLLAHPMKLVAHNGDVTVVRKRETPEEIGKRFGW